MTVMEAEELICRVVEGCIPKVQKFLLEEEKQFLTTGDRVIDGVLSGGIPLGHVIEIAGER